MFADTMAFTANVLLFMFGFVFTVGGGNRVSTLLGVIALIVAVCNMAARAGLLG